jgi:hypothetical protein
MLNRIVAIEPRQNFRLYVRFEDGIEGEADLSDIAGRGVFRRWLEHPGEFQEVRVDEQSGAPTWPGGLDVAPDALYVELSEGRDAAAAREP